MADDLILNSGSGGGTVRALQDAGSIYWPAGVTAFATSVGTPDVLQVVTPTAGLPIKIETGASIPVTDNSGSLTVDAPVGTPVFVRLSDGSAAISTLPVSLASVPSHAVTNAGTFAVQVSNTANVSANLTLINGETPETDNGISGLGTLRVTLASDSTGVVGLTGAALTSLQLIDNLVLAEDAAHGSGDPGVQALAVRNDSDASLCGTTGDYTPLQVDANGYLKVNIKAGAGSGGTASTDDAAFTAASGSGTPLMGFVTSDSVDSGDVGVVGMLANRQLKVTLFDSGGSELSVGGGTQYTEDAAAAANPVGNSLNLVRDDARSGSLTTTDGDNVAARGTNAGELYVKHVDTIPVTQSGTWNVTNVSGTVSLPTGAATESTLSTLNGKVTACNTGAVVLSSGTVTTVSTVTNVATIGTSVTPGTSAAHLGKAEDAAHASGDTGVMALAVRSNTAASTSGADGDYQPLITNTTGHLWVDASGQTLTVGSHNVTNAGTFAVQATIAAGATTIAKAEDVASADADVGVPSMAVRKATPANTSGTDGDYEFLQMSAGRLWTSATIDAALPAGTNGIGKLTSNSGVTIGAVEIASAQTLGTVTTVSTVTTCSTVTTLANGQTAHDSAVSGSPLRVGARAETALSGITLVADGDATDLYAGVDGVLITRPHCNLEDIVQERTTNTDGASTAFASGLAAPGSGVRLYIKSVDICNSSASFCTVDLRDGSGGSVLWTLPVPATGGVVKTFDPPLKLTANTALAFDASAATTTLTISANGFRSKV